MPASQQDKEHYANSPLLKRIMREKEELDVLKWLESEKAGHDIGVNTAIVKWRLRQCHSQPLSAVKNENVDVKSEHEAPDTVHKDSETTNTDLGNRDS